MAPKITQPGPARNIQVHQLRLFSGVFGRHEAQVVVLLGDLRDQRQADAGGQQRRAEVEPLTPFSPW